MPPGTEAVPVHVPASAATGASGGTGGGGAAEVSREAARRRRRSRRARAALAAPARGGTRAVTLVRAAARVAVRVAPVLTQARAAARMAGRVAPELTGGGSGGSSGGAAGRGGSGGSGGTDGGAAGSNSGPQPFVFGVPPAAAAHFKKGINLGNRLEAPNEGSWGGVDSGRGLSVHCPARLRPRSDPDSVQRPRLGRLPVLHRRRLFGRRQRRLEPGSIRELAVLVDMHAYDELATDVAAQRNRFVALWTQVATRCQSRPDTVAFELLNEPNGQLDTASINLMVPAVRAIRASDPAASSQSSTPFSGPSNEAFHTGAPPTTRTSWRQIHLYEPKLFTFQGMSWMGPAYLTTGVVFPGPPDNTGHSSPGSQGRGLGQPVV